MGSLSPDVESFLIMAGSVVLFLVVLYFVVRMVAALFRGIGSFIVNNSGLVSLMSFVFALMSIPFILGLPGNARFYPLAVLMFFSCVLMFSAYLSSPNNKSAGGRK